MDFYCSLAERKTLRESVRRHGWDAFLASIQGTVPDFEIYKVSTSWLDEDFILKAKGVGGDIVVWFN